MVRLSLLLLLLFSFQVSYSQSKKVYTPKIQTCDCNFKLDSSYYAIVPPKLKADSIFNFKNDSNHQTLCGYLIVPENRKKVSSKMIRLPFIILKSKNPGKKNDPFLFTTGGPGGSSLGWTNGISKSTVIGSRDCIAFEQRGTHFAIPNLRTFELDVALRESYRKNLNKDSMWMEGVKRYKKKLEQKGVDLSGYSTEETAADLVDFLNVMKIDSVNLVAGSYGAMPMLELAKKVPSKVRSIVLDSPLPNFVPIEEDEPRNFMEALTILSAHCDKDSSDKVRYGNLMSRFETYFNSIINKKFYFPYVEKGTTDTLQIEYTKNELLDITVSSMLNVPLKEVPFIVTEIISGNHAVYIQKKLDDIFNKNIAPGGMRMLVHCADQTAYNKPEIVEQLYNVYPFLRGFHVNDVYKEVCDCWKVPPVSAQSAQPFYSSIPVLIGDGEMDAACRPIYMSRIKHYMPNAQCFLFINRGHGVDGSFYRQMIQTFLDNPYNKIESTNEKVVAY